MLGSWQPYGPDMLRRAKSLRQTAGGSLTLHRASRPKPANNRVRHRLWLAPPLASGCMSPVQPANRRRAGPQTPQDGDHRNTDDMARGMHAGVPSRRPSYPRWSQGLVDHSDCTLSSFCSTPCAGCEDAGCKHASAGHDLGPAPRTPTDATQQLGCRHNCTPNSPPLHTTSLGERYN
jgi:hypothetical protein